jgi:hypothetical protein
MATLRLKCHAPFFLILTQYSTRGHYSEEGVAIILKMKPLKEKRARKTSYSQHYLSQVWRVPTN